MSLDGVAEEPGNWFFNSGADVFENLGEIIERQTDVILGRGTYDYWVGYWPTSDVEPFATFINTTTKHVATSTALNATWSNTSVISRPLVDYVRHLKFADGGDIGVHGSMDVARSLLAAGLVDVIQLVVAPALAGAGGRLFGDLAGVDRLTLERVAADGDGNVFMTYRRRPR
jgi:dihydrofolate reductase